MSPKFGKNKKDPKDPQAGSTPATTPVDPTQATPDAPHLDTSQAPAAPSTHPDPEAPEPGRVTEPPVSRESTPATSQVTEAPASPEPRPGQVTEPPVSREPEPVPVPATPQEAIRAFIDGRHQQPHDLLGHHLEPEGLVVRAFRPFAASVAVRFADGEQVAMEHESDGVWRGLRPGATQTQDYRLLVAYGDGIEHVQDDPYRFAPTLGDLDRYLIGEGRHEQLWTVLGAHVREYGGPMGTVVGTSFAVWAPRAQAVHVVGDFNGWDNRTARRCRCPGGPSPASGSSSSPASVTVPSTSSWSAGPTAACARRPTRWRGRPSCPPDGRRGSSSRATTGRTRTGCATAPGTTRTPRR